MSSLKPKFLYQVAVSFLYSVAPLVVFPYVARTLGPGPIGQINFIDYTAQLLLLLSAFGIPLYGVREVARKRNDAAAANTIVSELVSVHLLMSMLGVVIFLGFILLGPPEFIQKHLIVLALLNILVSSFSIEWLLQGHEQFRFIALRSAAIKITGIVLVFLLVKNPSDHISYYAILIFSNVALVISDLFFALKKLDLRFSFKGLSLRKHLGPLAIFFSTTAAISLYTYFDTYILGVITGSLAVGYYTTGLKIIKLSQNFVNELSGILLPRISFLADGGQNEEVHRLLDKSLRYVLTLAIPLTFFFYINAPEIVTVLAGASFQPSVSVVRILSFIPLINGLSNIYIFQILFPFRQERRVLIGVAAGSIVSIGGGLALVPYWSEDASALACMLAELSVTIFTGVAASRLIRLQYQPKFMLRVIASSLIFLPLALGVRGTISNDIYVLLISGILSLLTFAVMQLWIFPNAIAWEVVRFFKLPLSPRLSKQAA